MNKKPSFVRSAGGHAIDLWRLFCFRPSNPHSLSKFRQLLAVGKRTDARTFVETGTFLGYTARRASKYFDRVITIELVSELYEQAKLSLADRTNIECVLGDCNSLLPEILDRADVSDCLIYLDGHFSGGVTGMTDIPEPAIDEIRTIGRFRDKVASVVIDDFRTFTGVDDMPTKSSLIRSIEEYLPEFEIKVHLDQVLVERC